MARKTLKQKLRKQVRDLRDVVVIQHQQAGITINYEQRKLQAVAMAHGVMATLMNARKALPLSGLDEESEFFKTLEKQAQGHIAQCVVTLVGLGISHEEANEAIMRGY